MTEGVEAIETAEALADQLGALQRRVVGAVALIGQMREALAMEQTLSEALFDRLDASLMGIALLIE